MHRFVLNLLTALAITCCCVHPARAGVVHWADFPDGISAGPTFTVPLSSGASVDVRIQTGGTQGVGVAHADTLGALATGLDYAALHLLTIYNGGGSGSVLTRITFSNFQLGAGHQRGFFLVGAVSGPSSPVTLGCSVPGRVGTWTTVGGTFDYGQFNSYPIDWDAQEGEFQTSANSGIDSRCIVVDLGPLTSSDTITVTLQQALPDGIVFALGEEVGSTTSAGDRVAAGLALAPARPNPARAGVTLDFSLPAAGRARLTAFDLAGRRLATLADRDYAAGSYSVTWDLRDDAGRPVSPGLVFVRLETAEGARGARVLVAH